MRGEPSANLIGFLSRLKLATAAEIYGAAGRVRRLAGELPDFDSVWVDALVQARVLTPFQAAEINAGRGEALRRGPYVISQPLPSPRFGACYSARHMETLRCVRLFVLTRPQVPAATAARSLQKLIEQESPLRGPTAAVIEDAGFEGAMVWGACSVVEGVTAADWMVENGRLPAPVVLHIAREMTARLADLERLGVVHGDPSVAGLILQPSGHIVLPMAGLRTIVRPSEGYGLADLQPEAYDSLAPERIAEGSPPDTASDVYACGCVWWHLLTGRPPLAGGNSLAKLRAAHAAKVLDVRQLAPEVPENLARTIDRCLTHDPGERPSSMVELCTMLGAPQRSGAAALAQCLHRQIQLWQEIWPARSSRTGGSKKLAVAGSAATIAALVLVGLVPMWRGRFVPQPAAIRSSSEGKEALPAAPLSQVKQATYVDSKKDETKRRGDVAVAADRARLSASVDSLDDIVLPGGNTLRLEKLDLKPGQRVRGRPGERPLVSVPSGGLMVHCENVCFDGIDFVVPATSPGRANRNAAMLVVAAQEIAFRGCSFSSVAQNAPQAIQWSGDSVAAKGVAGELIFTDCVFSGLSAVVECQSLGQVSLEMRNSLCVASGPLLRLRRAPKSDQSNTVSLHRVTLRGDSGVLECPLERLPAEIGTIAISATDTVLATNPDNGLLVLSGVQRPESLLQAIAWKGEGSLVSPDTAIAVWRGGPGEQRVLPEEDLDVAGLVRSEVTFAGNAEGAPSASSVSRWQVPLRSAEPPGAITNSLFLPHLRDKRKN